MSSTSEEISDTDRFMPTPRNRVTLVLREKLGVIFLCGIRVMQCCVRGGVCEESASLLEQIRDGSLQVRRATQAEPSIRKRSHVHACTITIKQVKEITGRRCQRDARGR